MLAGKVSNLIRGGVDGYGEDEPPISDADPFKSLPLPN